MLNIKDAEAHHLARQLAQETGETMTRAVTEALRLRLAQVRRQRAAQNMADDLLAIGRRCRASLVATPAAHADLLFDNQGLPR